MEFRGGKDNWVVRWGTLGSSLGRMSKYVGLWNKHDVGPSQPPFIHLSRILFTVQGSASLRAAAQALSETAGIHKTANLAKSKRG